MIFPITEGNPGISKWNKGAGYRTMYEWLLGLWRHWNTLVKAVAVKSPLKLASWQTSILCVSLDDEVFSLTKDPDHEFFWMTNNEYFIISLFKLFARPIMWLLNKGRPAAKIRYSLLSQRRRKNSFQFWTSNFQNRVERKCPWFASPRTNTSRTLEHFCVFETHIHTAQTSKSCYKIGPLSRDLWANTSQYLLSSQITSISFLFSKPFQKVYHMKWQQWFRDPIP